MPTPIEQLLEEVKTLNSTNTWCIGKIPIATSNGYKFVKTKEIIHIQADRSYCRIFLTSSDSILVSKPLKHIVKILPSLFFTRVHAGHLVQIAHIQFFNTIDNFIILSNGAHIPVARRRKKTLLNAIKT